MNKHKIKNNDDDHEPFAKEMENNGKKYESNKQSFGVAWLRYGGFLKSTAAAPK